VDGSRASFKNLSVAAWAVAPQDLPVRVGRCCADQARVGHAPAGGLPERADPGIIWTAGKTERRVMAGESGCPPSPRPAAAPL